MVEMPEYTLIGADGPVRLADVFDGRSQLIVYNHMWTDGAEWQCGGCTGFTSQFTRLEFLDNYDARFVIVTNGPIEEALAYKAKVGNKMDWYSSSESSFGADVGAAPGAGFAVNVFLRDGDTVYRTWHTDGRGTEQLSHSFALIDLLPWGRQEEWQDSPDGWPKSPTYSGWVELRRTSPAAYGTAAEAALRLTCDRDTRFHRSAAAPPSRTTAASGQAELVASRGARRQRRHRLGRRHSWSASQPPPPSAARSSPPVSPGWPPARSRWRSASTSR